MAYLNHKLGQVTKSLAVCAAAATLFLSLPSLAAQTLPDGLVFESLVTQVLDLPTDFARLPDGRVLILERNTGNIEMWTPQNGNQSTLVGTILDIHQGGERGLLSICVDPGFAINGYVYLWTTRLGNPGIELLRYECAGDLNLGTSVDLILVQATEFVVLAAIPDSSHLHNGGTIRFGPDGMLYVSIGDDSASLMAQDSASLLGCVLRLDVSGLPAGPGFALRADLDPGDNPFSDSGIIEERLTLAWGLRNPFSFNIDQLSGDLFVADVGGSARNEFDQIVFGPGSGPATASNFGWPFREGVVAGPVSPPSGSNPLQYVEPIDDRVHFVEGFAIISAGVYHNQGGAFDWGLDYEGAVFHSDFISGETERLEFNIALNTWQTALPVPGQPTPEHWATGFSGFVRFDLGGDGAMYALDYAAGRFGRIRPATATHVMLPIGGDDQVGMRNLDFGEAFSFRLEDANGLPLAGEIVKIVTSANAIVVGPDCKLTDVLGEVSFDLRPLEGGVVTALAEHQFSSASATMQAFARGLELTYLPGASIDILVAEFINTSLAVNPVPTIFVAVPVSEPTTNTMFGVVAFDVLIPGDTVAIEDPTGLLGPALELEGGYGTPGHTNVYAVPTGFLSGSLRFQAIWVDFSTPTSIAGVAPSGVALSNIIVVNF
ncbi:MAG: PQQ-dependent sugar dehydrogenase [Planctomycetota bacterium]